MKAREAALLFRQILDSLHQKGTVTVTPEAYEKINEAFIVLTEEKKDGANVDGANG